MEKKILVVFRLWISYNIDGDFRPRARALEKGEKKQGFRAQKLEKGEGKEGINFPEIVQKGNKDIKGDERKEKKRKRKRNGWTKCIDIKQSKEQGKKNGLKQMLTKQNYNLTLVPLKEPSSAMTNSKHAQHKKKMDFIFFFPSFQYHGSFTSP